MGVLLFLLYVRVIFFVQGLSANDMRLRQKVSKISGKLVRAAQSAGGAVAALLRGQEREMSARKRGFLSDLPVLGATLLLAALFAGAPSPALAVEKFCSEFSANGVPGVVDGNVLGTSPVQVTIDTTCTFQNWPTSNPLSATINFQTNDPTIYLILFDNVWYTGNMACANIDHKLWVVNSEEGAFSGACQDIMVPAETIAKRSPAATATIGLPFTYTLTLPSMNFPVGASSSHDLGAITISDDLGATGADLTLVELKAYLKGTTTAVPITTLPDSTNKYLHFTLPDITAGDQVVVEVTAVLNDTPANVPGMQFINTAKWSFARWIDLDEDGIQDANEYFNPLPGESGISTPMTIVGPNLVVNKTSPATALNVTDTALFTIDVQNSGGGDAWNSTITDKIPTGMCATDPTATLSARIVQADGATLVKALVPGTDYSTSFSACQFALTMTDATAIAPEQHLVIDYQTQLDPGFINDGATLTNVAGATRWFSANTLLAGRRQFSRTLTDGTPAILDFQDSQTVTAALHGYYFEKTVQNLTSLANPATIAAPGDRLRYKLRVFNVDQTINTVTLRDTLDLNYLDAATLGNVRITAAAGYNATWSFNAATGLLQISGAPTLNVDVRGELLVEFDINLKTGLANGTAVPNQAVLASADPDGSGPKTPIIVNSDDPYLNGVASPDITGDEDPTIVTIRTPGPLSKANPAKTSATIGERFEYTITVPAIASPLPLYDVQILDNLPANLRFVSARVVTGGAWALSNTGSGNALLLEDITATGIDIPANGQAKIAITVELVNSAPNQASAAFNNSASYSYNRANGVDSTKLSGGSGTTPNMTVTEPLVSASKTARFVTPAGKPASDPATVGDVLEYLVTIVNSGSSTAFDANIVDTLPANVAPVAGSATARINGVAVTGFVANPATPAGTTLIWGRGNGDGNLDIPAGQSLLLTYQVLVVDASAVSSFTNSAYVDWTSLDEDFPLDLTNPFPGRERTGAGCPSTTLPNDYCAGPASVTVQTSDKTSIVKSVNSDSYAETPAATGTPVVRVGDTVTYDLKLNLQEYTTRNVAVVDTLPAGLALQSFSLISGANLSYTLGVQPAAGATGALRWELGDVINTPDGNAANDAVVIRYVARVVTGAPTAGVPLNSSILINNQARLSYTGGDPALYPTRLTSTATIEVRQPQMGAISKVDLGTGRFGTGSAADPYQVNIAGDVMKFQLKACNNGLAPAYGVRITDLLASQLNEASITAPVVAVGGTILTAGTGYSYSAPAGRGGTMSFTLITPVNPGQCATVDYNVGFHTDLTSQATWSNQAQLPQYSSLPVDGRLYSAAGTAQVWMTNVVQVQPLSNTLMSPAEATIGQEVLYQIKVPALPMNAVLANVVLTDTLHGALEYLGATAVDAAGGAVAMTDTSVAPGSVRLTIAQIAPGQQVTVTLRSRVANNASANAGVSFTNSASYSYTGMPAGSATSGASAPLTIVEPSLSLANSVTPTAPPSAGDVLHYTVTLTAPSGANFSNAFDAGLVDTLSLGLSYVAGSARVGGAAVEPTLAGDGTGTPQTLTWGGIDVVEGGSVAVSYDVRVLTTVVAGQRLTNGVTARWTSLDGASAGERTGSGTPAYNDYFTGPVTTTLTVSDNNSLTKSIVADSYLDAPSTLSDKTGRIGDSATYRLTLKLGEGTNLSVKVRDVLPAGMAYQSLVGITPVSGGTSFSYSVVAQPAPGATGSLTWDLGNVVNTPSGNNTPFDALIIEYRASVRPDAGIAHLPGTTLVNSATLSYQDAAGSTVVDPARLVSSDTLTVWQPVMSPIVKLGNGAGNSATTPLNVKVASETVHFQLRSCNNTGLAPAYGVRISDLLASQLNEGSITAPVVAVGGTTLAAGSGYSYTAPAARGGSMIFVLNTPVPPGQCATIDYNIGFHTDFGPNQTWSNSATLNEYWSLPAQAGQRYLPTGSSSFYMINKVEVTPLTKTLVSPVAPAEATIGEEAVYRITVPGVAVSASLDNVVLSDTLHPALAYVSASATLNGAALTLTTTQSGQNLSWALGTIPAGQQAVITLTTRVANNGSANAGVAVANSASYSYTGLPAGAVTSGAAAPLTILEPSLGVAKTVANLTRPGAAPMAGETLRYSVTLNAASGANFSSAFDAGLVETLGLGVAYQAGSATVNGSGNSIANPAVSGDGGTTPQTLTWDLAGASADIDIAEGSTVVLSYDVLVLDTVVAGQVLTNSGTVRWTGLDGTNGNERTGVDGIGGLNDYLATAAAQPLTVPVPTPTLLMTVDKPVANPGDRLRYTMVIENPTGVRLSNLTLVDAMSPMFQYNSIGNVVLPAGASYQVTDGSFTVTDLTVGPRESVTIVCEAALQTYLKSGTVVLNQAELRGLWSAPILSDDNLSVLPDANPTRTVIPANGVVYDAVSRKPLAGVTLTMQLASTQSALPASCFIDPSQQNQVTPVSGEYKFDLQFDPTNCPAGADYLIAATAAPAGHVAEPSLVLVASARSTTEPYPVPVCPADAIPATTQCEALPSASAPTGASTTYYLHLTLDATANQIFNNHIPIDPKIEEKIYITKKSPLRKVTRGQLVPYVISFKNTLRSAVPALTIADTLPAGFKYVPGSSRVDGTAREPVQNGRQLSWGNIELGYNQEHSIKLLAIVGAGVSEGEYVNQAQVINSATGASFSEIATATVRVIPDPTFDSTDVIGKVFDDRNLNGAQDAGEKGLPGVRVVTARGLIVSTDQHGRFHISSAVVPDEDRGSNFILKLDDRSLPTGYRVTTENPRVLRATRGKTLRFNFGATVHHVVGLDVADGVFEPGTVQMRGQWVPNVGRLLEQLKKSPSVLRLSYLGDVEPEALVRKRLDSLKKEIDRQWAQSQGGYRLTIETEVFWRRGAPAER